MIREAELYQAPFQTAESDVPHAHDTATFLKARLAFAEFARTSDGKLHLLVYGKVITGHVDPIEKKPVVHYMPGSKIFSIATTGCNWLCHYCQNFDISQRRKVEGSDHSQEDIAGMAVSHGCQGLAYTYNQPTIFIEFARDVGLEAHRRGLVNIFVSNGYDTPEAVSVMGGFLDCITIDFKGNEETEFLRKYVGIPDAGAIFQTIQETRDKTKIQSK